MGQQRVQKITSIGCDLGLGDRQRAWVEIDLSAIKHNVKELKNLLAPQTALMAVVKADAYGHGAVMVAKTVIEAGSDWLGVATVPEGIELRSNGIEAPILILGATYIIEQIEAVAHWQLQPTLGSVDAATLYSQTLKDNLPVHLKLDTGMSRLGVFWQETVEFVQLVHDLPHLQIASIYSHLATAESSDRTIMNLQQQRFETAIAQLADINLPLPCKHLANSAATLTAPSLHYDLVRVGLAIYGLYPATSLQSAVNLKPVLQVKARITQVKTIMPQTGVSYGHTFISDRTTLIAIVGIGYADGVPRNLSNQMTVIIRGKKIPQIGAITMDQLMLDVSAIPDLKSGEIVTILGIDGNERISADDWAKQLNTISWEILCSFKHRLPRIAVENN